MREKIENTLKAIVKNVGKIGSCYGTEIGSRDEMRWLVEQTAREGILLSLRDAPEQYEKRNNGTYECFYYFDAIAAGGDKDKVRAFADTKPLPSSRDLKRMLPDDSTTDPELLRQAENIRLVRKVVMAREARIRKREREEKRRAEEEAELWRQEQQEREAAAERNRQEAIRQEEEDRQRKLQESMERELADRKEAADHRNDLTWLVDRIQSLGWEVTLRRRNE